MLLFDIETGALPDDQLRHLFTPPEPPPHPGEFDPKSVKLGNLKDQAKIDAKIEAAKKDHDAAVAGYGQACEDLRKSSFDSFRADAALDAATGRILAIGFMNRQGEFVCADGGGSEEQLLHDFWQQVHRCRAERRSMVGLNIHEFDLPFIVRRSWLLDISVPEWIIRDNRFWDRMFVDLRKVWLCGQFAGNCKSNFDHLGKAFGTGGKIDGLDGSQFASLWDNDRQQAIAYLRNDLMQPRFWAIKMGIL